MNRAITLVADGQKGFVNVGTFFWLEGKRRSKVHVMVRTPKLLYVVLTPKTQ